MEASLFPDDLQRNIAQKTILQAHPSCPWHAWEEQSCKIPQCVIAFIMSLFPDDDVIYMGYIVNNGCLGKIV